jgi:hypothetical protein
MLCIFAACFTVSIIKVAPASVRNSHGNVDLAAAWQQQTPATKEKTSGPLERNLVFETWAAVVPPSNKVHRAFVNLTGCILPI